MTVTGGAPLGAGRSGGVSRPAEAALGQVGAPSTSPLHVHERVALGFGRHVTEYAIVTLDLEATALTWNPGAERIFGVAAPEMLGTSFLRFFLPEDLADGTAQRHVALAIENGSDRLETWLQRTDGTRFWASCLLTAIPDATGTIEAFGMILRDLSEYQEAKAIEAALRTQVALQERLARIAETAPGVIHAFERDALGRRSMRYVSPGIAELYGISVEEAMADPTAMSRAIDRDDLARLAQEIEQSARDLTVFRSEWRYQHPTKGEIWIQVHSAPLREEGGGTVWHGFLRDITERKRMELDLLRHKEQLEEAQRVGGVGSFTYDLVADVAEWSPEHMRIFEQDPDEPVPTAFEDFLPRVHPFDRKLLRTAFEQGKRDGQQFQVDYRIVKPDGEIRWIHANSAFELDEAGEPVHLTGTVQDITETRNLEEQLRQAQKMEAVGRLAGGVAHDFNNLLTVINGHAELLLASAAPGESRRSLESIRQAGEHAAVLTRRLLAFSRKQILDVRVFDVNAVVVDLEGMIRRLIGEDVVLETELAATEPIRADVGQLEQVLLNLVVNARDAMPNGGPLRIATSTVEVGEGETASDGPIEPGRYALLTVADGGEGIAADVIANIFEPFFTTKQVGKGTGLGLSMVFGIVRQSGGYVRVESEQGHGATFEILLPVAPVESVGPRVATETHAPVAGAATVLVVEDDEGVRRMAADALRTRGYSVVEAADGREALAIVALGGHIDLLLSDVVMPVMGGIELARALAETHLEIRILLMSGYASDHDRGNIRSTGHAFLSKPFSLGTLTEKVRAVLEADADG